MQVLRDEIEVVDALTGLGLTVEVLTDAMRAGELARDECTPNDPTAAPGFFSYARTTRRLRELLIPDGWARDDQDNLALVISPSKTIAIAVSTGDEGTGIETLPVKSKYPKGPATITAVDQNRQLELFPDFFPQREVVHWKTWLLLRRRVDDKLYCELSLPHEMGGDGRVVEWSRRIIITPLVLGPVIASEGDDDGPIVIDVPRRS